MTTSTTQCEEKKILADAKYLGLVEFVQGPIMEGEANVAPQPLVVKLSKSMFDGHHGQY